MKLKTINKLSIILESLYYIFESIDKIKKKYVGNGKFSEEEFNKILELIPDIKRNKEGKPIKIGRVGRWFLDLLLANNIKDPEKVFPRVESALKIINKYIDNRDKFFNIELDSIKTLDDLKRVLIFQDLRIDPLKTAKTTLTNAQYSRLQDQLVNRLKTDKEKLNKEAPIIFENDRWIIRRPLTEPASCLLGKRTNWCTAANSKGNLFYSNYPPEKGLYYNIQDKNNPDNIYVMYFSDYDEDSQTYSHCEFRDGMNVSVDIEPMKFLKIIGFKNPPFKSAAKVDTYSLEDYRNGDDDFWKNLNKEDFLLGLLVAKPPVDLILDTLDKNDYNIFSTALKEVQFSEEELDKIFEKIQTMDTSDLRVVSFLFSLAYQENLSDKFKKYIIDHFPAIGIMLGTLQNDYDVTKKSLEKLNVEQIAGATIMWDILKDKKIINLLVKKLPLDDINYNSIKKGAKGLLERGLTEEEANTIIKKISTFFDGNLTDDEEELVSYIINTYPDTFSNEIIFEFFNLYKKYIDIDSSKAFSKENVLKLIKNHYSVEALNSIIEYIIKYNYNSKEFLKEIYDYIKELYFKKGELTKYGFAKLMNLFIKLDYFDYDLKNLFEKFIKPYLNKINSDTELKNAISIRNGIGKLIEYFIVNTDDEEIYKYLLNKLGKIRIISYFLKNNKFKEKYKKEIFNNFISSYELNDIIKYAENLNKLDIDLFIDAINKNKVDEASKGYLLERLIETVISTSDYDTIKYLESKLKNIEKVYYGYVYRNKNLSLNDLFRLISDFELSRKGEIITRFINERGTDTFSVKDIKKAIKTSGFSPDLIRSILISELPLEEKKQIFKIVDKNFLSSVDFSTLNNEEIQTLFLIDPVKFSDIILFFNRGDFNLTPEFKNKIKTTFLNTLNFIRDLTFPNWIEVILDSLTTEDIDKFLTIMNNYLKDFRYEPEYRDYVVFTNNKEIPFKEILKPSDIHKNKVLNKVKSEINKDLIKALIPNRYLTKLNIDQNYEEIKNYIYKYLTENLDSLIGSIISRGFLRIPKKEFFNFLKKNLIRYYDRDRLKIKSENLITDFLKSNNDPLKYIFDNDRTLSNLIALGIQRAVRENTRK